MRIEQLDIRQLPGLDDPFSLRPGPGVTLVVGPNASGKSSLARAVRDLLWPARHDGGVRWLRAMLKMGDDALTVTCDGGPPVWTRGGAPVPAPSLPAAHLADCYRLVAADLLGEGRAFDSGLATAIRTEMTGGYDLDDLAAKLPLPSARAAGDLVRSLQAAREETANVERAQADLAARREGLAELEGKIAAAEAAGLQLAALEAERELRTATRALGEAEAALAAFPRVMDAVRPDDLQTFNHLRETVATRRSRVTGLEADSAELERRLTGLAVAADLDGEALLLRLTALAEACRRSAHAADLAGERRATLEHSLRAGTAAAESDTLTGLHRETAGLDATAQALGTGLGDTEAAAPGSRLRPLVLLAGGAALTVLTALPMLPSTAVRLAAAFGGIVLFGLGAFDLSAWSRRRTLADLHARLTRLAAEARAKRDDLAQRADELATAAARADEAKRRHEADLEAAGQALADWGLPRPRTAAAVDAAVADLRQRLKSRDDLAARLVRARRDRDEAVREAAAAGTQLTALLDRLQLPPDTAEGAPVGALCERLSAWRRAQDSWRAAEAAHRTRHQEAERRARAADLDQELDDAGLTAAIAAAAANAAEAGHLSRQLGSLQQELRIAEAGHGLAEALAREDAVRDDVSAWCAETREQLAEAALLAELRQQHEALAAPPRLREANRLLDEFTLGRYAVALSGATFVVEDRQAGRPLQLAQLSDGTRMQVLLAVRVAFIGGIETGARPPLILDEALTTSDPERLAAVATSLGRLAAATGRQVLYLSSQPSDVGAWRGALQRAGLPEPCILDLAVARNRGRAAGPDQLAPTLPQPVPAPDGRDAADYGALLGVARFDPRRPWQQTDTFHLASSDLQLVQRLRTAGLVTAGVLADALPRLGNAGIADDGQRARLCAALAVLPAFVAAWRIGRPRAVTIEDVDKSDAVSDVFRPRVLEVLAESGWRAERFLAAAADGAVPRFQARKLEALREHLAEAGCLDDRTPLSADELVTEVLLRTATGAETEARTSAEEVRALVHRLLRAMPQELAG